MSRTPIPPTPSDTGLVDRPTFVGSALIASAALAFAPLGGLLFLPWSFGRLCHAIRRVDDVEADQREPARVWASGFVCLATFVVPIVISYAAYERVRTTGSASPWTILGPMGLVLTLLPLLSRLPLVLSIDRSLTRPSSLLEALERSIALAIAAPRATLLATLGLVGAATVLALVGRGLARMMPSFDLYTTMGTIALAPWAFGGVLLALSMHTPDEPPAARPWMMGVLATLVTAPVLLLVLAGLLATAEPRALTVVRDGHGVQAVRGMQRELGPRGVYDGLGYRVRSDLDGLVIEHEDHTLTHLAGRYRPSDAVIHRRGCSGWQAYLRRPCDELVLDGPDWRMTVVVGASGERLDDSPLDRALERLGAPGLIAFVVAALGLAYGLTRVSRIRARARQIAGRDRKHRLPARLVLGEGGALEGTTLVGEHNRVVLRDGERTLRLPTKQGVLAIQRGSERLAVGVPVDVVVGCDTVPSIMVHRAVEAPLPSDASIVIGEPDVIESDALGDARRELGRLVAVTVVLGAVAHLTLTFA